MHHNCDQKGAPNTIETEMLPETGASSFDSVSRLTLFPIRNSSESWILGSASDRARSRNSVDCSLQEGSGTEVHHAVLDHIWSRGF